MAVQQTVSDERGERVVEEESILAEFADGLVDVKLGWMPREDEVQQSVLENVLVGRLAGRPAVTLIAHRS